METKDIQQTVLFEAAPLEVYNLIMDAQKHAEFTGSPVMMSDKIDGTFRVFDGYCQGYNIALARGKKIEQAWLFQEDGWPKDHYSICTFVFDKSPEGTVLTFTQTGIPEHKTETLAEGWHEYYWEPMKKYLKDIS